MLGPLPIIFGIAVVWLIFQLLTGNFVSARNLTNLSVQLTVILALALGAYIVILTGQIDLSMGSVLGASASLLALLLQNHWSAWTAILMTLAFGLAVGLLQGAVTAFLGVPSFVVTLGGFLAIMGLQLVLVGNAGEIGIYDPAILAIANDYLPFWAGWVLFVMVIPIAFAMYVAERRSWVRARLDVQPTWRTIFWRMVSLVVVVGIGVAAYNTYIGIPYVVVLVAALTLMLGWITTRTPFGRHLYAVGGNSAAADRAGISIVRVKMTALALSGVLSAVAGIISASMVFAVSSLTGGGTLLLEAIAAVVIGGTSLFGGGGRIYQPVLGALVIVSIENGLGLHGDAVATSYVITGSILVVAVSVDAISKRRR